MQELQENSRNEFVRTVFTEWRKQLQIESATPLVLISVGHNKNHGKLAILTSQNIPPAELEHALKTLLVDLQGKQVKKPTFASRIVKMFKHSNN